MASSNEKILNITFQLFNDKIHDTAITFILDFFFEIEKMKCIFTINIPENEGDRSFKRTLVSTSVDMGKLLEGTRGNFATQAFMENYMKSIDFEPKLPFKKVKNDFQS